MINEIKDLCEQMELECINALTEINSKQTYYVICDPKTKEENLYSYDEVKLKYENFLND